MTLTKKLMHRLGLIGLSLALCGTLVACDDDEGIAESAYKSGYASELCTLLFQCDCNLDMEFTSVQCDAIAEQSLDVRSQVAEINGLSYDGTCAQEQIDDLTALACSSPSQQVGDDGDCERPCKVYYGPMRAGESCEYTAAGDNCEQGSVCSDGVCVNPCDEIEPARVGELCYSLACEEGAWCDDSTPYAPICKAFPGAGQPCVDLNDGDYYPNYACGDGLVCDETTDPATPVCVALPAVGEPCPDGDCAAGAYCDFLAAEPTCADLPGLNEPCTEQGFCDFDLGLTCDTAMAEPTCVDSGALICNFNP